MVAQVVQSLLQQPHQLRSVEHPARPHVLGRRRRTRRAVGRAHHRHALACRRPPAPPQHLPCIGQSYACSGGSVAVLARGVATRRGVDGAASDSEWQASGGKRDDAIGWGNGPRMETCHPMPHQRAGREGFLCREIRMVDAPSTERRVRLHGGGESELGLCASPTTTVSRERSRPATACELIGSHRGRPCSPPWRSIPALCERPHTHAPLSPLVRVPSEHSLALFLFRRSDRLQGVRCAVTTRKRRGGRAAASIHLPNCGMTERRNFA
jgi:hypothetical protein